MRELNITKLSDEFGQYLVLLTCRCGHTRRCHPSTLANIAGWDASLSDVVKRMRCSKCDKKTCFAKTIRESKPRKLPDSR